MAAPLSAALFCSVTASSDAPAALGVGQRGGDGGAGLAGEVDGAAAEGGVGGEQSAVDGGGGVVGQKGGAAVAVGDVGDEAGAALDLQAAAAAGVQRTAVSGDVAVEQRVAVEAQRQHVGGIEGGVDLHGAAEGRAVVDEGAVGGDDDSVGVGQGQRLRDGDGAAALAGGVALEAAVAQQQRPL